MGQVIAKVLGLPLPRPDQEVQYDKGLFNSAFENRMYNVKKWIDVRKLKEYNKNHAIKEINGLETQKYVFVPEEMNFKPKEREFLTNNFSDSVLK